MSSRVRGAGILGLVLVVAVLFAGCGKKGVMSPEAFTSEVAAAFRTAEPQTKVQIERELELRVTRADGQESTAFLNNAYDLYKQDPSAVTEVIQRVIAVSADSARTVGEPLDTAHLVPIIKDRAWMEETRQAMQSRNMGTAPEYVYEDLNADLVVVYAVDSPKSIRYLTPTELAEMKIKAADLRGLAVQNLLRILPKIERHGSDGSYMFTAGGDYEASLLLAESIWRDKGAAVLGDPVVAIPSRDLFVLTGSGDPAGIKRMRDLVQKAYEGGAYRLTPKLFRYRDGKFEEFVGDGE